MNKKILISPSSFGRCGIEPLNILKSNGYEVINNTLGRKLTEEEVVELGKDVIGILAGVENLSKNVLTNLPNLKCISRVGVGVDSIDLDYARIKNIDVLNTPDGPTRAVAELTLTLTLDLLRRTYVADANIKNKIWKKEIGYLIQNKIVGIYGFGRIGKETAKIFMGVGAQVIAYDLFPNYEYAKKYGIQFVDKDEIIKVSDILTIHVPGNINRTPIISFGEFNSMKRSAFLINVARGGVVDEDALYISLKNNIISGAACDVFISEPYSGELINLNNILLTPHLGSYAKEAKLKMEIDAVNNLISSLRTRL
ncbi:MAG: phosphoglycerate dehydrogenase [Ignavibacteriaceae bacterium]